MLLMPHQDDSSKRVAFFVFAGLLHVGLLLALVMNDQDILEMVEKGTKDTQVTVEIDPAWGDQTELEDSDQSDSTPSPESKPQEEQVIAKAPTPPPVTPTPPQKLAKPAASAAPKKVTPPTPPQKIATPQKPAAASRLTAPPTSNELAIPDPEFSPGLSDESSDLESQLVAANDTPTPPAEDFSERVSGAQTRLNEPTPTKEFAQHDVQSFDEEIDRENERLEEERLKSIAAAARDTLGLGSGAEASTTQAYGVPDGARDYRSLAQRPGNVIPSYDAEDRLRRREGTVNFLAYVQRDGQLAKIKMKQSSGHRSLDYKSLEAVKTWRFVPGQEGWVEIPILWTLVGEPEELNSPLRR